MGLTLQKRLIENWLPKELEKLGSEGGREKSIRHGHISTLHLWWARRPVTSMGAIVLSSLLPDMSYAEERELFQSFIGWETFNTSADTALLELLQKHYPEQPPRILDPFMGGGSTGLAATKLGCEVFGQDLNPVSYIIQMATLVYPQKYGVALKNQFQRWSKVFETIVLEKTRRIYESIDTKYFWTQTISCDRCSSLIPIVRDWWLAKTQSAKIAIHPNFVNGDVNPSFEIQSGTEINFDPSNGTLQRDQIVCPQCGTSHNIETLTANKHGHIFGETLLACVGQGGTNRVYRIATDDDREKFQSAQKQLDDLLRLQPQAIPTELIPRTSVSHLQRFGITSWHHLFNTRQLLVQIEMCEAVKTVFEQIHQETGNRELAQAVVTYFALAVDQIANRNSKLCSWSAVSQTSSASFARQALPMVWNYVESSALHELRKVIELTDKVLNNLVAIGGRPASISIGDSRNLNDYSDNFFDAIITDPPYYDAVQYTDLSGFFYIWLKRSIGFLYPDVFNPELFKSSEELTAAPNENQDRLSAVQAYESGMKQFYDEALRTLKENGILVLLFALKVSRNEISNKEEQDPIFESPFMRQLEMLFEVGLVPTATWPLSTEMRPARDRHIPIASTVVIVCRKRLKKQPAIDFLRARAIIRSQVRQRFNTFQEIELPDEDYFISTIGTALDFYGSYERVAKDDNTNATLRDLIEVVANEITDLALVRDLTHDQK